MMIVKVIASQGIMRPLWPAMVMVVVFLVAALSHIPTVSAFWTAKPTTLSRHSLVSERGNSDVMVRSATSTSKNPSSLGGSWQETWKGPKYNISLLLIDHYDSFTYNLYDYFAQLTVEPPTIIAKDAFEEWQDSWKDQFDGIILSPGPGTPQEQPALSHQAISKNSHMPVLGVCLGHQLMALNYGAQVSHAPIPIHGQDHWITQELRDLDLETSFALFREMPSSFRVVRYHSLAAFDLPECLQVTARSKGDQVIQAMQHITHPHYGVQFHPESIGTQHGMAIVENFCRIVQSYKKQRQDVFSSSGGVTLESSRTKEKIFSQPLATRAATSKQTKSPRFRVVAHPFQTSALPEQVFHALYRNESHAMWLDSSSASSSRGEMDILAVPSSRDDIIEYHHTDDSTDILTRLEHELFGDRQPASQELALIHHLSDPVVFEKDNQIDSMLPFHYRGGFLGYLGYEVRHDTKRHLHQMEGGYSTIPPKKDNMTDSMSSKTPTAAFFLARNSLVYHHPTTTWYMIGLLEEQDQNLSDIQEWMQATKARILQLQQDTRLDERSTLTDSALDPTQLVFNPNRSKETYEADIGKCHEFIRQGESYELCLTNQLEAHLSEPRSTWDLYKILRRRNPAPYSSFFRWNSQKTLNNLTICCSSPERFMSVQRKQLHPEVPMVLQAEAKPIKGTEARVLPQNGVCRTEAEDREDKRRARSLELSAKNRAENLMIVDLLRNDMSRVCQIGSVHVSKLMAIESYATVHQMVSTIRGTLAATVANDDEVSSSSPSSSTSIDLLRAAFPGGSMTGAPKIRTMELLEELEQGVERGPYAGSLGYLSVNGCMDMNIIIRSAIITENRNGDEENGQRIRIGAGGAITALSDTQDEYDEMLLKARAVVQAVQAWAAAEKSFLSSKLRLELELSSEQVKEGEESNEEPSAAECN